MTFNQSHSQKQLSLASTNFTSPSPLLLWLQLFVINTHCHLLCYVMVHFFSDFPPICMEKLGGHLATSWPTTLLLHAPLYQSADLAAPGRRPPVGDPATPFLSSVLAFVCCFPTMTMRPVDLGPAGGVPSLAPLRPPSPPQAQLGRRHLP